MMNWNDRDDENSDPWQNFRSAAEMMENMQNLVKDMQDGKLSDDDLAERLHKYGVNTSLAGQIKQQLAFRRNMPHYTGPTTPNPWAGFQAGFQGNDRAIAVQVRRQQARLDLLAGLLFLGIALAIGFLAGQNNGGVFQNVPGIVLWSAAMFGCYQFLRGLLGIR
jgi:hypothetical protein